MYSIGQFWNIPILVQPYTVPQDTTGSLYNVTVIPTSAPERSFLGDLFARTWDNTKETCLYIGNGQGGPSGEFADLPGSVIEGRYTDYMVQPQEMFSTNFKFTRVKRACAA